MSSLELIALSDVHLTSSNPIGRKDNMIKTQFKKLRFVFNYAKENNCIILQAGDFLDKSRDWVLLVALMKFFRSYPDVRFYCVLGQHDKYFYSNTKGTTLGILEQMNLITILDYKTPFGIGALNIFGSSWGDPLPEPAHPTDNILVTHRPIADRQIYPGQEYTDYQKFFDDHPEYKLILVGDIHRSFHLNNNKRYIVNTGPMLRAEANEYNIDHHTPHFFHFTYKHSYIDKSKNKMYGKIVSIPHKPSEEVLSRSHIIEREDIDISELSSLIEEVVDQDSNKIKLEKVFKDKSIKPRIRKRMKEIYDDAKG